MIQNEYNRPPLWEIQERYADRMRKWSHYYGIYTEYFEQFRGKEITVLEIGVDRGGSLEMWRDYFGPQARIAGLDIKRPEEVPEGVEIRKGDQGDIKFMQELGEELKPDIVIDDGGHTMAQQLISISALYHNTRSLYCVEDTHTSYFADYGGGLRFRGSFVEFAKESVDKLHAWFSRDKESLKPDQFTLTTTGIHFHDSLCIFEKGDHPGPKPL